MNHGRKLSKDEAHAAIDAYKAMNSTKQTHAPTPNWAESAWGELNSELNEGMTAQRAASIIARHASTQHASLVEQNRKLREALEAAVKHLEAIRNSNKNAFGFSENEELGSLVLLAQAEARAVLAECGKQD